MLYLKQTIYLLLSDRDSQEFNYYIFVKFIFKLKTVIIDTQIYMAKNIRK